MGPELSRENAVTLQGGSGSRGAGSPGPGAVPSHGDEGQSQPRFSSADPEGLGGLSSPGVRGAPASVRAGSSAHILVRARETPDSLHIPGP